MYPYTLLVTDISKNDRLKQACPMSTPRWYHAPKIPWRTDYNEPVKRKTKPRGTTSVIPQRKTSVMTDGARSTVPTYSQRRNIPLRGTKCTPLHGNPMPLRVVNWWLNGFQMSCSPPETRHIDSWSRQWNEEPSQTKLLNKKSLAEWQMVRIHAVPHTHGRCKIHLLYVWDM